MTTARRLSTRPAALYTRARPRLRLGGTTCHVPRPQQTAEILSRLADAVPPDAAVTEVAIGPLWTVVATTAGAGMSSTFSWHPTHRQGAAAVRRAGALVGTSAREVIRDAQQGTPLEASLALAALGAALPRCDAAGRSNGNAGDLLCEAGRDRVVAVIGHFPFVERLRPLCRRLDVFELPGRMQPGDLPSSEIEAVVPAAEVVAITATTLLTRSLATVLAACSASALTVMLGPSTPLSPILWSCGIDVLCGVEVTDATTAMRCAAEGANLRQMDGLEKVVFRRPPQL